MGFESSHKEVTVALCSKCQYIQLFRFHKVKTEKKKLLNTQYEFGLVHSTIVQFFEFDALESFVSLFGVDIIPSAVMQFDCGECIR